MLISTSQPRNVSYEERKALRLKKFAEISPTDSQLTMEINPNVQYQDATLQSHLMLPDTGIDIDAHQPESGSLLGKAPNAVKRFRRAKRYWIVEPLVRNIGTNRRPLTRQTRPGKVTLLQLEASVTTLTAKQEASAWRNFDWLTKLVRRTLVKMRLFVIRELGLKGRVSYDVSFIVDKMMTCVRKGKFAAAKDDCRLALNWFRESRNANFHFDLFDLLERIHIFLSSIVFITGPTMINEPAIMKTAAKLLLDIGVTPLTDLPTFDPRQRTMTARRRPRNARRQRNARRRRNGPSN